MSETDETAASRPRRALAMAIRGNGRKGAKKSNVSAAKKRRSGAAAKVGRKAQARKIASKAKTKKAAHKAAAGKTGRKTAPKKAGRKKAATQTGRPAPNKKIAHKAAAKKIARKTPAARASGKGAPSRAGRKRLATGLGPLAGIEAHPLEGASRAAPRRRRITVIRRKTVVEHVELEVGVSALEHLAGQGEGTGNALIGGGKLPGVSIERFSDAGEASFGWGTLPGQEGDPLEGPGGDKDPLKKR
jgi:hypothetical protein